MGVPEHRDRPVVEVIAHHLGASEVLIVLDNCEHLIQAVTEFAQRLLFACPRVRVLATSRERLALTGEVLLAARPRRLGVLARSLGRDVERPQEVDEALHDAIHVPVTNRLRMALGEALLPSTDHAVDVAPA
jgi:predicted ATPase